MFRIRQLVSLLKEFPLLADPLIQIYLVAQKARIYLFESANFFGKGKSISRFLGEDFIVLRDLATQYQIKIIREDEEQTFPRYFFVHQDHFDFFHQHRNNLITLLGFYPGFQRHDFSNQTVERISYTITIRIKQSEALITVIGERNKTSEQELRKFVNQEVDRLQQFFPASCLVTSEIKLIIPEQVLEDKLSYNFFRQHLNSYMNLLYNNFTVEGKMNLLFEKWARDQKEYQKVEPFLRAFIHLLVGEYFSSHGKSPAAIQKFEQRLLSFERRLTFDENVEQLSNKWNEMNMK